MTRTLEIRFTILRSGADFGALYAQEGSAPTLRMNAGSEIKTSLRGTFLQPAAFDRLQDQIRPELWIDGVMHPLGIFLPATVEEGESEGVKTLTIEAYDRSWIVRDPRRGQQLLDRRQIRRSGREWEAGTSYLEIVNELLGEINYNPLWFSDQGFAVLEPASVPTASAIRHRLDAKDVKSLLLPQFSRQTDVYSAPNVWICVCSNPDKGADLVATAENNNPQSPLSVMRRGRRISKFVRVRNIASLNELQAYADRLRDESMISGETVTAVTRLLPGFGVRDVTALHYGDFDGICVETGWTMQLKVGGTMTHTLEKVVYNLA